MCVFERRKNMRDKFILIDKVIPNVILDIRYYSDYNFVGERIDGYLDDCAIVTIECAKALKKVSDEISKYGYVLKIFDAYRPQMAVDHFVRWSRTSNDSMKRLFYNNINKKEIFDNGYVSFKSSHSRGSTVDITFYDLNNCCDLDVGGDFDLFDDISKYDSLNITDKQRKNRMFLRNLMIKYGFVPFDSEWWHFTLKDEPFPDTYFNFPVSRTIF